MGPRFSVVAVDVNTRKQSIMNRSHFILVLVAFAVSLKAKDQPAHPSAKWEKAIAAFEEADRKSPPPQGGIEFIGASGIARWKTLTEDFPGLAVYNRGFGGSQIEDS